MIVQPFEEMRRLQEKMDTLFGSFFGDRGLIPYGEKKLDSYEGFRFPMAEVREEKGTVIAKVEVPGVKKEDIELNVTDTALEIKAESASEKEMEKKGEYKFHKLAHKFYRRIPMPQEVKADKAHGSYKDGILTVVIPTRRPLPQKKKHVKIR